MINARDRLDKALEHRKQAIKDYARTLKAQGLKADWWRCETGDNVVHKKHTENTGLRKAVKQV